MVLHAHNKTRVMYVRERCYKYICALVTKGGEKDDKREIYNPKCLRAREKNRVQDTGVDLSKLKAARP